MSRVIGQERKLCAGLLKMTYEQCL